MSPDICTWLTNIALIIGNMGLFIVFVGWPVSPVLAILGGLLTILSLYQLYMATFTEAGIIPRQTQEQFAAKWGGRPIPTGKDSRGRTVTLKACRTCHIYRPVRTSHCRDCGCCVMEFDHHCPWVSNCVGKRNYKYFVGFILSTNLLIIYLFCASLVILIHEASLSSLGEAIQKYPVAGMELVVSFVFSWCLMSLGSYHMYLIKSQLTTKEDITGSRQRTRRGCGSMFADTWNLVTSVTIPSLLALDELTTVPNREAPLHDIPETKTAASVGVRDEERGLTADLEVGGEESIVTVSEEVSNTQLDGVVITNDNDWSSQDPTLTEDDNSGSTQSSKVHPSIV
jgi:hypothetical protein